MRVSYMIQLVSNLATTPQCRLEMDGIAHSTPSPVGEETHGSFGQNLRSWAVATFDFISPAGNAVNEAGMRSDDEHGVAGIAEIVEDVPVPHLFLLDMQIGR